MLRCESRAGLGDPVDPVVKMTSAPSEGEMEQVFGGFESFGDFERQGEKRPRSVNAIRGWRELHKVLHGGAVLLHGAAQFAEVGSGRGTEKSEGLCPQRVDAANDLARREAQVKRGQNHAQLEAGKLQEDVLGQKRQRGGEVVALAQSHGLQGAGQLGAGQVESGPVDFGLAVRVDDGRAVRLFVRPLAQDVMEQMTVGIAVFVVGECELWNNGHAGSSTSV